MTTSDVRPLETSPAAKMLQASNDNNQCCDDTFRSEKDVQCFGVEGKAATDVGHEMNEDSQKQIGIGAQV
jgi:hypothetical protein